MDGVTKIKLDLDHDERFQLLRKPLGIHSFGLNLVLLNPGQRGRIHRHLKQEEVYLVLDGALTLLVEGEELLLGRGELARVAPHVRRQLLNAGPDRLALLAIGGGSERHVGRDGEAFASWEDTEGAPPQDVPLPEDLT